jgi:carboxylesterase type B
MAWHMRLFVERQVALGKKGYWYTFTHEPPIEPGARDLKATHATEIVYAFNNLWAPRVFPDAELAEAGDGVREGQGDGRADVVVLGELRQDRRPER